ncbi:SDR family NAD(P)-dependent oxidoreductase [Microbacterium lacticum]
MRYENTCVVITGAGSGIGETMARRFSAEGAAVVIGDIDAAAGDAVAASLPTALSLPTDVRSRPQLERLIAAAEKRFGGVDVFINNAMSCTEKSFLDLTPDDVQRDIDVTLVGPFLAAQAVIPALRRRGGGVIVNIASVNGLAYFGNEAYSAAKAGLISLTGSVANQFGKDGIRCVAIAPGTIQTPYWDHRLAEDPHVFDKAMRWYPLGRLGRRDDIADAALFLASAQASWITGAVIPVDGGLMTGNSAMADDIVPAAREEGDDVL